MLPLSIYAQHESKLSSQATGLSSDITTTENFRLLRDDPNAKLIISCKLSITTHHFLAQHN